MNQTSIFSCTVEEPVEVVIDELVSNTQYFYRIRFQATGENMWAEGNEYSFYTQRAPSENFTFTIISDTHPNLPMFFNQSLYEQTLNNVINDNPDFQIDLGDSFAMDYVDTIEEAQLAYRSHRSNMAQISHSVPLFLVIGNHENEEGWNIDDIPPQPILGVNARKMYYPNPIPDDFYSGNEDTHPEIEGDQLKEDYYAWEWGNALFVVLDPYWYTMIWPSEGDFYGGEGADGEEQGDRWDWTLGEEQYLWFKQTLEESTTTFKFVFSHHVTGGIIPYGRGGAAAAPYFEWGGLNWDGTPGFATERPGWEIPIHQLMLENGVNVFFHGHDHFYGKEDIDGMVYQECPLPADSNYNSTGFYEGDLYPIGIILPNSGHLRVTVSPDEATVDYVRAYLPGDGPNGEVAYSYTIEADSETSDNHPPVAYEKAVITYEDTPVDITLTASDVDGDSLTYTIVDSSSHGTLEGTAPDVTYTPDADYTGTDNFTFQVNDGQEDSNIATVTITIISRPPRMILEFNVISRRLPCKYQPRQHLH